MIEAAQFLAALRANGVGFFTGVPDSLLKDFYNHVVDHAGAGNDVIAANEGAALGLAAGHFMGTGEPALVYLQNSGLGNVVNPLTSLVDPEVYGIPVLLLIGWRGEPGVKDEPQHVKQGRVTPALLDALEIPHQILPDNPGQLDQAVALAVRQARERRGPVALVVRQGTFAKYAKRTQARSSHPLSREEAISHVVELISPDAVVVSTTGMASRELFELRERRGEGHERDFLTVGSMGHALAIALGVARTRPARPVYCLDGDGALLMHMGSLATVGQESPANLKHIVLNNGAHDSVGGQPTVAFQLDIPAIARACGYRWATRVDDAAALTQGLQQLQEQSGPALLEIRLRTGARPDLGRPTIPPARNLADFMQFLARS